MCPERSSTDSRFRGSARIEDSLLDSAGAHPDSDAIVAVGATHNYHDLASRCLRFAGVLVNAGVCANDRVGIYLDKTLDSVVALYAVWIAGGIPVLVNEGLRGPQLAHIIGDAGCRLLVSNSRKLRRLDAMYLCGAAVIEVSHAGKAVERVRHEGGDTAAVLLYTSGSSGKPKGVLVSHANLIAGVEIVSGYLGLTSADRILSALPFSFDYGLNQLLTAVHCRACCVLQRSMFPADLCRSLQENEITVFAGVPPLWIQLMQDVSPFAEMDFPSLRILTNTGGVFPVELVMRYRAKLPEARIYLMYGLSEAFRSSYLPPDEIGARPNSIGKAIPRCELFVLNEAGHECAPGEVGELVHRGPTVALGYWNAPDATAKVFRRDPIDPSRQQRVVYSGDLVRRDEDGFLYFVARRDQMIKSMGYRISPEDVEEQLLASGLIAEAVIGARPDVVAGQVVVAHIVPVDATTFHDADLLRYCRRQMPGHMIPVEFNLHDALPRTSSGKFDRRRLLG